MIVINLGNCFRCNFIEIKFPAKSKVFFTHICTVEDSSLKTFSCEFKYSISCGKLKTCLKDLSCLLFGMHLCESSDE